MSYKVGFLTREEAKELLLSAKDKKGFTWSQLGKAMGLSPVYTAMLVYGYGQAREEEASKLTDILEIPADVREEVKRVLTKAPYRAPSQPWPPTDPFVYRLYEVVLLYGPVIKDVAHELFGDGIMSAIDMSIDVQKIEEPTGTPRMVLTLNGKWLHYKKF
ncbi:MAG: cyanase [Aquificaceae bacterium]|jgi:cyanate lyase|uniref:Cyanate hydratase n=1 Tax=Hydrogenobacter sp. TaxID=2152829 RepID=A0A7C2V708_9AQUI|nr:cyanase [Aquificaceae bacterium]QWK12540.1 MAG: cyanase [Aquificota bacterium]